MVAAFGSNRGARVDEDVGIEADNHRSCISSRVKARSGGPVSLERSPIGQSCLNLAAARLRHIVGTAWSTKRYMNMRPLYQPQLIGL